MQEIKCPSCGSPNVERIDTDKYQCPYCGHTFTVRKEVEAAPIPRQPQPRFQQPQVNNTQDYLADFDDEPGCLMNGLCFLIPLVGIIMYFVKKDSQPNCAKSYLTWALISIAIGIGWNFFLCL